MLGLNTLYSHELYVPNLYDRKLILSALLHFSCLSQTQHILFGKLTGYSLDSRCEWPLDVSPLVEERRSTNKSLRSWNREFTQLQDSSFSIFFKIYQCEFITHYFKHINCLRCEPPTGNQREASSSLRMKSQSDDGNGQRSSAEVYSSALCDWDRI